MTDTESSVADPFTTVYEALWDSVESHEPLIELVRVGNRIKFVKETEDHDPRKSVMNFGAAPELLLIPDYFTGSLQIDNRQGLLDRNWNWVIRTGNRLLNKSLFPVEYELLRAMRNARKSLLELQFDQQPLVLHVSLTRGSSSLPEVDKEFKNPLNLAWYSIWTIQTRLHIL